MTKQNVSKFGLRRINALKSKQHEFYELVFEGVPQLESFEKKLEAKYQSEFRSIMTIMDLCSNGQLLPQNKMKDITPHKQSIKEYEFKTRHLRIYAIQHPGSKVVVLCGYKNNQTSDIVRFRALKQQLLSEQKEQINYGKK